MGEVTRTTASITQWAQGYGVLTKVVEKKRVLGAHLLSRYLLISGRMVDQAGIA